MLTVSGIEFTIAGDAVSAGVSDPKITVTNSGNVVATSSGTAIHFLHDIVPYNATLSVAGSVVSQGGVGVWFDWNGGNLTVSETGQIRGGSFGVVVNFSLLNPALEIENNGVISGDVAVGAGSGNDRIDNLGVVDGLAGTAIQTFDGDDRVINTGTIVGNVDLGAGADTFDGRGGTVNGTVMGGAGDDVFILDDPTASISDTSGTDTVKIAVDYTLGADIENLKLLGGNAINGTGNALGNTVTGNNAANVLKGLGGADTLLGRGGNDVLKGGGAGDQMAGGGGADRLIGGGGNDLIDGNAGHDVLIGGRGHDTFFFSTGDGHETVKDFDATDDAEKIDLSHAGGITGFHNLRVNHMSQVGANVVIDAGGGDVLTLAHVQMSDLQAADFIF